MLDALDDLSPRIEAVDLGVALVDVTGLEPRWGSERRIAARAVALARTVAPLRVRCGVGENRWLATLAARLARFERPAAPAAFRILEREELAGLPLNLLPVDPATSQRLALFGLTRMRQLAELPASAVGAQFGSAGERLQSLARGRDGRPIVPRRRPERVEAHSTFETPLEGIGTATLTVRRLAAELCDRLRARHLAPGRAILSLALEDAPALRVAQPFPQPALEPDWIARLLLSRVEAAARARLYSCRQPTDNEATRPPGRLLSVTAADNSQSRTDRPSSVGYQSGQITAVTTDDPSEPRVASVHLSFDHLVDPATRQLPAFEARAGRWEELRWSLERIGHRFGEGRVWRAVADRPMAALPEHQSRLVEIGP
jgi:nucleotidyltransferase/DNA polymerase involved in DNA repair